MEDPRAVDLAPGLVVDGAVATLSLRRPGKLNRLIPSDLVELQRHCRTIDAAPEIRVVVFTAETAGQARPLFSAGYDVGAFDDRDHDPNLFEQTSEALARLRPVVIGGLNGSVYGGATDLVLACDLRIGLPGLTWRMPACAIGLHYYPSGLRRYLAAFGAERSRQLFLSAGPVSSEQLQHWGVLMELVEPDLWPTRLGELARQIAALAPLAAQATKASLRELALGQADDAALRERERLCAASADAHEGRRALVERRTPLFQGR